jgi:hypothetical protein
VHAVVLDPLDFIARLCALIPPPRFHMLRYHGVLAALAKARPEVVPGPVSVPTEPMQMPLSLDSAATELEGSESASTRAMSSGVLASFTKRIARQRGMS